MLLQRSLKEHVLLGNTDSVILAAISNADPPLIHCNNVSTLVDTMLLAVRHYELNDNVAAVKLVEEGQMRAKHTFYYRRGSHKYYL